MSKRIIVGITGASGALYAKRTVELLVAAGVEVHLVVSPLGQRLLHDELGMEGIDLEALAGCSLTRGASSASSAWWFIGAACGVAFRRSRPRRRVL